MTGETITRLRGTPTEDRYHDTVVDWSDPDELDINGCIVAPRGEGEAHEDGRQGVIVGFTIYAPAGTDVAASDRLTIRGHDHEVDGEPGTWTDPWTGVTKGIELQARRVDG